MIASMTPARQSSEKKIVTGLLLDLEFDRSSKVNKTFARYIVLNTLT